MLSDAAQATNEGSPDRRITNSRGFQRISLLPDGGFEDYKCPSEEDLCFTDHASEWTAITASGNFTDAAIFFNKAYARSGNGVGILGEVSQRDNLPGILTPATPLQTVAGSQYKIALFHKSGFGDDSYKYAFVDVRWNGNVAITIRPVSNAWTYYEGIVTAIGEDVLEFYGGNAPSWSFIDDISVFQV